MNPGAVWRIPTRPFRAAHFAVFPIDIPLHCVRAGCRAGGTVLDPFSGTATTGLAALQLDIDPIAAEAVRRIFAEFIAGLGLQAIAEGLTRDGNPSPAAHDPVRNLHRCGIARCGTGSAPTRS
jgi:DNA methylase/Recombinase